MRSENVLKLRNTFEKRQESSIAPQWELGAGAALLNTCLTQPPKTHRTSSIPAKAFEESTAINLHMHTGKRDWEVCLPLIKLFTTVFYLSDVQLPRYKGKGELKWWSYHSITFSEVEEYLGLRSCCEDVIHVTQSLICGTGNMVLWFPSLTAHYNTKKTFISVFSGGEAKVNRIMEFFWLEKTFNIIKSNH